MKEVESKLRAEIKTHEEAEGTQVQSLRKSLAERDLELQKKSSSNTQLQQWLESSKLELMRAGKLGGGETVRQAGDVI